jgi:hypothetical protein
MITPVIAILGAPDPEMERIEHILDALRPDGPLVYRAAAPDGRRVTASEAYSVEYVLNSGDEIVHVDDLRPALRDGEAILLVECDLAVALDGVRLIRADHHRPGDPGYGAPPALFWQASSIGQVLWALRDLIASVTEHRRSCRCCSPAVPIVPADVRYAAAADHCLAAAYAGECPGIDPDELLAWRVDTRAEHQGRSPEELEADVAHARARLGEAPKVEIGGVQVADLREAGFIPELPEAAARDGVPFLARVTDRGGTQKIVLQAAPAAAVAAFLEDPAAIVRGAVGQVYGDPARGFAGAYV